MTSRPGGQGGPENVDALFAEIVADLAREGVGAEQSEQELSDAPMAMDESVTTTAGPSTDTVEDEHFIPPDPPPLPRPQPGTMFGLSLLAIGVLLLLGPEVFGLAPQIGTPLALISLAAGIGWLILHRHRGPPPNSGWDDGAQV